MNIKDMSNKELLSCFGSIIYVSGLNDTRDDNSDMYEAELLSRLEAGGKAIKRYELVRIMSPRDFAGVYLNNIQGGGDFDQIIDDCIAWKEKVK